MAPMRCRFMLIAALILCISEARALEVLAALTQAEVLNAMHAHCISLSWMATPHVHTVLHRGLGHAVCTFDSSIITILESLGTDSFRRVDLVLQVRQIRAHCFMNATP